jgi:hypothetical protein
MISYVKERLLRFITHYLPKRGRRILFVVTCYLTWSKVKDEQRMKHDIIEINNKLHLSKDEQALQFALEIRHILFQLKDFKSLLSLKGEDLNPKAIVSNIPAWMRYDENIKRVYDELSCVFKPRYQTQIAC